MIHDLIKQKYIENSLIKTLTPYDLCGTVTLEWFSGTKLLIRVIGISESDNDKELHDPEYMEFMIACVKVVKIIECTQSIEEMKNLLGSFPYEEIGYVIHFNNAPDLILDGDTVIWKKPEIPNHAQYDMCDS